jgi:hypothetical protein
LIVNSYFEASGAPINELNGSFSLDGGDGCIDVFGDDISSVHHRAGHIFSVSGVTLGHHIGWLEAAVGDFSD